MSVHVKLDLFATVFMIHFGKKMGGFVCRRKFIRMHQCSQSKFSM